MKPWIKLGSLVDRNQDKKEERQRPGLVDRLTSMVASIERRIREAFDNGQAARRFDSAKVVVLPPNALEELREPPQVSEPRMMGRFDHVETTTLQFQDFEEVNAPDAPQTVATESFPNKKFTRPR